MKKILRSPVVTGLLFLLAVVLLFAGSVGSTQAALQVFSSDYLSELKMNHIGVSLLENEEKVSYRNYGSRAASGFSERQDGNLILKTLEDDPSFQIGRKYPFKITAVNSGIESEETSPIDQYLRITVYKYWVETGKGETFGDKGWFHGTSNYTTKMLDKKYDPALICLGYNGTKGYNSNNWVWDPEAHTDERDVYYYIGKLTPDSETEALFDTLWIDPSVAKIVKKSTDETTYTYAYDGYGFVVQVEVDAIQTHHARNAIRSAWGITNTGIMDRMQIPYDE